MCNDYMCDVQPADETRGSAYVYVEDVDAAAKRCKEQGMLHGTCAMGTLLACTCDRPFRQLHRQLCACATPADFGLRL
jgi:hypothetical protein